MFSLYCFIFWTTQEDSWMKIWEVYLQYSADKIKPNVDLRRGRQVWWRGTLSTVGELASQKVGIGEGKLQAKFLVLPVISS